jgi:hypothetical protein
MMRWSFLLCVAALWLSGCASLPVANAVVAEGVTAVDCAVTPYIEDQPPDDPNADPFSFGNWHINEDRSMWVGLPPDGAWGMGGEKVIWIRPAGAELVVSGQRLDADAPPLRADIPCCYPTGFQVTGLYFPTEGCWEVVATAGDHELRFVTEVKNEVKNTLQKEATPRGVGPTSPLATSVLLQFCTSAVCELRPVDSTTSLMTKGFEPIDLGGYAAYAPSNDLTQLAVIVYRNNANLRDGQLKFVELATWEVITTTLTFDDAFNAPRFSPDNSRLVVITQEPAHWSRNVVHLIDITSGKLLAEQPLDFYPTDFQFTPDGATLMLFGMGGEGVMQEIPTTEVALLDASNLETLWQTRVEGLLNGTYMKEGSNDPHDGIWWQPGAVFARDKAMLYVVHADQDQLTMIDFGTQSIRTRAITKPLSWVERLLMLTARTAYAKVANGVTKQATLSADGTQIYAVGTRYSAEAAEFTQTSIGLQVIDLATGEELAHIDTNAQSISVEPESGHLFLHGWIQEEGKYFTTEWTEVLDAGSYESLILFQNKAIIVGNRLDGQPILLSTVTLQNGQTELSILDPKTLDVISSSADWYRGDVGWVTLR